MNQFTKNNALEPLIDDVLRPLGLSIGCSLGLVLGLSVGLMTNDMATWLVVGIIGGSLLGLCVEPLMAKKQKQKDSSLFAQNGVKKTHH